MVLQERDIQVLAAHAHYFMLNSRQIREFCFPTDTTGRITRRRLTSMMHAGYVKKRNIQVVSPTDGSVSPVYHLTKTGREFLAGHFDDEHFLLKPIEPCQPQHLYHYVAVAESHRLFDRAVENQSDVQISKWCNEDEVINPKELDRSKHRRLRTEFSETSKVRCIPDAAFVLDYRDQKAVVYIEQDRDTFFHDRVAARKSPGYRELFARKWHREHFPETTLQFFYVLFLAPTKKRCEQLRGAFAKRNKDHDVRKVYRFGSLDELKESNLFFEPMYSCCHHDDPVSLVKRRD